MTGRAMSIVITNGGHAYINGVLMKITGVSEVSGRPNLSYRRLTASERADLVSTREGDPEGGGQVD